MKTLPCTLPLDKFSKIFKLGFAKYININRAEVADGIVSLSVRDEDGMKVYINCAVGNDDKVPVEIPLESKDTEMPYRFYRNLTGIIEAWDRALPHMSIEWREAVLMRMLPALTKLDYEVIPMLDQELVFAMNDVLDEGQELEVLAFDVAETPRYQKDGIVVTDEVLVLLPLEMGSDGRRHGVRTFPMLIVGDKIAFNQHYPVEIFKYPRIAMDDQEYIPTRTGKVQWYSTGFAAINELPTYDDGKEIVGKGVGHSGTVYELSLAGLLPVE